MKFRTKILICMVWVLALAIGIGGALLIHGSFSAALEWEKEGALRDYKILTSAMEVVASGSSVRSPEAVYDTLDQLYAGMDLVSIKLEQDGTSLYSQGEPFFENDDPEEGECLIWVWPTVWDDFLCVCGWVRFGEERVRLTIASSVGDVFLSRDQMLEAFRWVYLTAVILGGILSYILAYALTKPLTRVSTAAGKMAQGDLTVRLEPRGKDEIAQLSRDFDHMAQAIQDSMAARERFMASFAHELKTPMTSIIGYAALLRSQDLTGPEAREAANYIFSEGRRLEALSLKLLEILVTKSDELSLETVEVEQLIAALIRHLRPVYERQGIRLGCKCQSGTWEMDPVLMRSVLVNLLDNSRKAMDTSGAIRIGLDFPDGTCRIRVTDNGRGMPPEALAHLTEAFYRVDKSRSRAQGGAGLGLSLCHEIITRHGGTLSIQSRPGLGTIVTVTLRKRG